MRTKNIYIIPALLFIADSAFSQQATAPAPPAPFFQQISTQYWAAGLILFLLLIIIAVLSIVLKKVMKAYLNLLHPEKERVQEVLIQEQQKVKKESLWHRFDRKFLTRAVPVEREKDVLIEHPHDGIYELDNNLPPWWKYGFYFTIAFAFIYMISYHITGGGKLQLEEYADEMKKAEIEKAERLKNAAENINEQNVVALTDAAAIEEGKSIFLKNCAACHLPDGGGLVGPNLTDEFWIHGGGIKNIFRTVESGVPDKGMISWKAQLSPKQIQRVASFILTFKGTKPAVPKDPQGDKWTETEVPTSDSASTAQFSAIN